MTVTGMPAWNAIVSVVAAPPGLLTSADLRCAGSPGGSHRVECATTQVITRI